MNLPAPRQWLSYFLVVAANGVAMTCASAANLTIANASFESPTFADAGFAQQFISYAQQGGYGWSFTDASGIYNPPALDYTGAAASGIPAGAEGSQVGFSVQRYALFQTLAGPDGMVGTPDDPVLSQLTTYTLTLGIGQRLAGNQYAGVYGGYHIELLAGVGLGGTVIVQESDTVTPPAGTFINRTLTVDSATLGPSFATLFGQPLTIRMATTASGANAVTDFDNVRLDAVISALLPGDLSLNRHVDAADISAMLAVLTEVNQYQSSHGLTDAQLLKIADLDNSGAVTNTDIQALLNQLRSGGGSGSADRAAVVSEPTSVMTLCTGMLVIFIGQRMAVANRRRR